MKRLDSKLRLRAAARVMIEGMEAEDRGREVQRVRGMIEGQL